LVRALALRSLFASLTLAPVLGMLAMLAMLAMPRVAEAEPAVLDRIVAVVNDDIILASDLELWMLYDDRVTAEMGAMQQQNAGEEALVRKFEEMRPGALDELVARKLMLAQAPTYQISATEAEVESYLQNLARNAGLGGVPELKRAVEESLRYGTWAQYRAKLQDDIIIYKFLNTFLNIAVSDQQVLDRYRQLSKGEEARMQVRRLVFPSTEDPAQRDAQLKAAKAVVRRIGQGEDIETITQELGLDAEPEEVTRSGVSRPIGERLFAASAGDVVGPLESGQGYVVFVVEEVITSDVLGFEQAKEALRQQISDEVRTKAEADLREQLLGRAHVDIRL
jgi:peptidyl-prolyl cis-trans isomerase SurA